jgi:uroporphyrinogen decarboxylase
MKSHRERLEDCLAGIHPDRVPVVLWRHFPVDDLTAEGLASATLAFQRTFDFDLVKISPQSSFCLEDWGTQAVWRGAFEGTYTYTKRVIQQPEDWTRLAVLEPDQGRLELQLDCLRLLCHELGSSIPVIQTIFNPLSQAKNLAGGELLMVHLRRYPEMVHAGLKTITESSRRFIDYARRTGIAGIFYAIQHAQYGLMSPEEYINFGRYYDLQVLEMAQDLWLNMAHLHGNQVMFDLIADYPIQIINWHDRETEPSLSQALDRFPGVLCGGIQRDQTMVLGTPALVKTEAQQAIEATGAKRFILGTGCVIPITTPYGNIMAARRSVEALT